MTTVALIPLRGGSKSIPDKNIKMMAGKPLCYWVLNAALEAEGIDEVWVSTDSTDIMEVVKRVSPDIKCIRRPDRLATDTASTESVMLHFEEHVDFDHLVTIQATSPLLTSEDLFGALARYEKHEYDSMLSVVPIKRFFWSPYGTPLNYDYTNRPRRQEFLKSLSENGSFWITSRQTLVEKKCRLGGRIGMYTMGPTSEYEIDEPYHWTIVESLLMDEMRERSLHEWY